MNPNHHAAPTPFADGAPWRAAAAAQGSSGFADGAPQRPSVSGGTYGDGSTTGRPRVEMFADSMGPLPPAIGPSPEPNDPPATKLRTFVEGPRSLSVRATVYLRYLMYLFTIVFGSAITHACFAQTAWRAGGYFMFAGAVLMTVTAAVGTWFYTNHRREIIEQYKHYTLGIAVIPGTGIAVLNWAAQGLFTSPLGQTDAFIGALSSALPIIFFVTVIIPSAIFIKVIAGLRSLHRSRMDDQEAWEAYTRIDGLQR